jgi:hypothetical protein
MKVTYRIFGKTYSYETIFATRGADASFIAQVLRDGATSAAMRPIKDSDFL